MNTQLENWRLRASARSGARYPLELREDALVLVEQAVAAGWSRTAACSELGVPMRTLERWRSSVAFRQVEVVDEAGPIEVRLGALLARMSVETFAQLVRRLA